MNPREQDLLRAGLDAFLDDVLGLITLGQAAEHRDLHARLRRAGHNLDHVTLGLLLVRAHEAAFVIRPLAVADDHILPRAQAQYMHMLGVPPAQDRHAALEVGPGHEKSRHRSSHPVRLCFARYFRFFCTL